MFFLRRFARRFIPKIIRAWLGKRFDDVLICYWKISWWQKRKFKSLDPPKKNGVLLIGYPRGEFGVGYSLRLTALSLKKAGVTFKVFDFNVVSQASHKDNRLDDWITYLPEFKINIFCIGVDQIQLLKKTLGKKFFQNRYNILYGSWEFNRLPKKWVIYLKEINEIWAMSNFVGQMFRNSTTNFVHVFQHPVVLDLAKSSNRSQFQIQNNNFVFLFMFDFDSHIARKNPEAVIQAFEYAFPKSSQNSVSLVIKSINSDRHIKEHKTLEKLIDGDSRIIHIQKVLPHSQNSALMQSCDCYVSLHRSEGFGLTIAEAMLAGKPVITTAYSGNMDFTTNENSLLVDYKLIPVQQGDYPYAKNEMWAEPNIEQAGDYMRKMVKNRNFYGQFAKKGQELIKTSFNIQTMGEKYKKRLELILNEKAMSQNK